MSSRLPAAGDLYGLAGGGGPSGKPVHHPYIRSSASAVKRPLSDLDHLLRAVKPKTTTFHYLHPSPISPFDLLDFPSPVQKPAPPPPPPQQAEMTELKSRLEELEKHLLDDAPDEPPPSSSTSHWDDHAMHSLITAPSPKKLLMDVAQFISDGNPSAGAAVLRRLTSSSPEDRLCARLATALLDPQDPSSDLCSGEHLAAVQLLREASPCFKLSLLAANLAILDSSDGVATLHVVDFDVGHGLQYLSLLNSRVGSLSITAVADPLAPFSTNTAAPQMVRAAGDRLLKAAERSGISLHFKVVTLRASELSREALGCNPDDPLVVNLAFHLHKIPDESVTPANPRDELLRRVRALRPTLVMLVEQEMSANTIPFLPRVAESFTYYAALLASLEATTDGDAARLEDCLARKAANAAANEGADRVERCEVFGKWRARMGMAGFRPSPLTSSAADSLRSRLSGSFSVTETNGGLCFGYSGRILTFTSGWH